jgi:hypothetical protein
MGKRGKLFGVIEYQTGTLSNPTHTGEPALEPH